MNKVLVYILITTFLVVFLMILIPTANANENYWISKTALPQGGAVYGAAMVDGEIYAFGGYQYNGTTYYTSGKYDPATDTWTAISPMPSPRIEFATALYKIRFM